MIVSVFGVFLMVEWGAVFFDWGQHNAAGISFLTGKDIPLWVGQLAFITEIFFIIVIVLTVVENVARMFKYLCFVFFTITFISTLVVIQAI